MAEDWDDQAPRRDHDPGAATRNHRDRQSGHRHDRSEDSIEREIEQRANQATKNAIQDHEIQEIKAELESRSLQVRHLIEAVADAKARAKSVEKLVEVTREDMAQERREFSQKIDKATTDAAAAVTVANTGVIIANQNRQDLRALGWIHDVLRFIWNHKGKLGSGGGAVLLAILAKIFGYSPV